MIPEFINPVARFFDEWSICNRCKWDAGSIPAASTNNLFKINSLKIYRCH
ncbi:hypothetical protein CPter91_4029 [Collimonas pratensis]|uniref:Uncharacterized protein n=1 Tax=Collimonas pratensis TaxID=279113 RepID=A0A127Q8F3_9BURK|nr:hypothetical protein CPter91_4029 [Collimonas pratensis]